MTRKNSRQESKFAAPPSTVAASDIQYPVSADSASQPIPSSLLGGGGSPRIGTGTGRATAAGRASRPSMPDARWAATMHMEKGGHLAANLTVQILWASESGTSQFNIIGPLRTWWLALLGLPWRAAAAFCVVLRLSPLVSGCRRTMRLLAAPWLGAMSR